MLTSQRLQVKASERRERMLELAGLDELDDDQTVELRKLEAEAKNGEVQLRAALTAEAEAEADAAKESGTESRAGSEEDHDDRERLELRSRCSVGRFLQARIEQRSLTGAEAELAAEVGLAGGGIPMELWEPTVEERKAIEKRAVAGVPGTVGVNLDLIRPQVFAPSVLPRLGVEMPRVPSGTYATATITSTAAADSEGKGDAIAGTAATFAVTSAMPKRISARLELSLEDLAAVGQDNYESALRQNLAFSLSAELDNQGLNGAGSNDDLNGIFQRLTDPSAPAAGVADFDDFVAAYADGVDGLWATRIDEVGVLVGVETYQRACKTFRDTPSDGGDGEIAFSDYAMAHYGGLWTNSRMPAKASHIQQAILYRKGRSMVGGSEAMRTAVCPIWSEVMIDDVYTGSAKAERYVTFHVILGDVILVQPAAYKQVAFRVST